MEIHSAVSQWQPLAMRRPLAQGDALPVAGADVARQDVAQDAGDAGDEALTPSGVTESAKTGDERPASEGEGEGEWALSEDELRLVERLKARDAEVRAHEMAHVAAGGRYVTSGPTYDYQIGPDSKGYAIGGEVGIDTSMDAGDPAANLEKARAIIRAAMAPADPSGQDHQVAAAARSMEARAAQALQEEQQALAEEARQGKGSDVVAASEERGDPGMSSEATGDTQRKAEANGARSRLEQRVAGFFAAPTASGFSQFA